MEGRNAIKHIKMLLNSLFVIRTWDLIFVLPHLFESYGSFLQIEQPTSCGPWRVALAIRQCQQR